MGRDGKRGRKMERSRERWKEMVREGERWKEREGGEIGDIFLSFPIVINV